MTETVITVVSTVVALGALLTSIANHRHQTRRNRELDAREAARTRTLRQREEAVGARERAADRREQLIQASLLGVSLLEEPSPLHDGWRRHTLRITNSSNQPFTALQVHAQDDLMPCYPDHLSPGAEVKVLLPSNQPVSWQNTLQVTFTDAAGRRWMRDYNGALRQEISSSEGKRWGNREAPIVEPAPASPPAMDHRPPAYRGSYKRSRRSLWLSRRRPWLIWVLLLLALVFVGAGVQTFLFRS